MSKQISKTVGQLKGYVDLTKNNAIELTDQISNIDDSVAPIHYLSCRLCFVDAFAFIAKQHYPVKVYLNLVMLRYLMIYLKVLIAY